MMYTSVMKDLEVYSLMPVRILWGNPVMSVRILCASCSVSKDSVMYPVVS